MYIYYIILFGFILVLMYIIVFTYSLSKYYNFQYKLSNQSVVSFVFGTRPEIIKLAPVIKSFENYKNIKVVNIFTGQHQDLSNSFLELFNIIPTYRLKVMKYNQSLGLLTSTLLYRISEILNLLNPSLLIVQGDTTSAMAASLSAFYSNIPIAHIEAGLRTYKINSPFPEEMNRQLISKLSTYHFAATTFNIQNLNQDCLSSSKIYLVGNTVVDSLHYILLNNKKKINYINEKYGNIILFTIHRRENREYYVDIFNTMLKIIKENSDTILIYPIHPNPNVLNALLQLIPKEIYSNIIDRIKIKDEKYSFLNRLVLLKPISYSEMVYIMNISTIIVTDSGGIQEEAVSLGKKLLIIRESTERYEAVYYKAAILVGINPLNIYSNITCIINNKKECNEILISKSIYGRGNSGKKIANILMKNMPFKTEFRSSKCDLNNIIYDIIFVLTVWKRKNYIWQIELLYKQDYSKNYNILIVIYQNGNHINISDYSHFLNRKENIKLKYIHSEIDTGYFARFLIPLLFSSYSNSLFFVIDDDIRWGNLYFENMIKLVEKGYLATRNGRFVDKNGNYKVISYGKLKGIPILYDNYIEFDFGGHIWGGKIDWLKVLWNNPPPFIDTCEDIWISVVLKTYLGVKTATPKCNNITLSTIGEICACDDYTNNHESGIIGNSVNNDKNYREFRIHHIKQIMNIYNYSPIYKDFSIVKNLNSKYYTLNNSINIIDDMKSCKSWIG